MTRREASTFVMEYPCDAPDKPRWFVMHASRMDSGPAAVVISHTEISERKRAEEALGESEERFASFMRHLPGLAWIKDTDGRYAYANDAAVRAFEKRPEEFYGKKDEEIFDAETAAQFSGNDKKALESDSGLSTVETLRQNDGVLHHSLVNKFVIRDREGVAKGIGGVAIDITDRIDMEERLHEATEKLLEADRRKDEFLATLAHELRNPLAPILNGHKRGCRVLRAFTRLQRGANGCAGRQENAGRGGLERTWTGLNRHARAWSGEVVTAK